MREISVLEFASLQDLQLVESHYYPYGSKLIFESNGRQYRKDENYSGCYTCVYWALED